jgi:hypothetical protein
MAMDTDHYQRTERIRVRRLPERAAYDRATVHAILDEGFILLTMVYGTPQGRPHDRRI